MAYALYRGTRLGLALQEALGELEEYEQISPSVKSAVLRKFDETMCDKLENDVDSRLTIRAERLWSFRSVCWKKQGVIKLFFFLLLDFAIQSGSCC